MPIRPLLETTLAALFAACCLAALWDVRGVFRGFARSAPVAIDLADAVEDQCFVSGQTMVSTGTDAKLEWKGFSFGSVWLEIDVEPQESTVLQAFWGVPDAPSFSPHRKISRPIAPGRTRLYVPLPTKVQGVRLDFGNQPNQAFHIRSISAIRGPLRIRPWSWTVFGWRAICLFFPLCLLAGHAFFPAHRIWDFVDGHRFALALGVLLFAVGLNVNGSSLAMWNRHVRNPSAHPPLFGEERPIRSDEWAVFTPMTTAQSFADAPWPYFNGIPRAETTDMFSVYAQPVRHPLLLFRPFLAGHLLFGFSRGLAFFWTARWLALLLAMYGLFKLLTGGDKTLSAVASFLVFLSPVVQWWGAINALAEMLIFGSLFVLCLDRVLKSGAFRNRCWPMLGMGYAAVAYFMTLYPAAMVPLAYVFGAIALWVVLRSVRSFRPDGATLGFAAVVFMACVVSLLAYLRLSGDAFRILSRTVYPGQRFDCGGGWLRGLALSWGNLFFPWTSHAIETNNPFEQAMFLDFFPLGIALFAVSWSRRKRPDACSILLLAVGAVLGGYSIVGLPPWAARLSLLSRSIPPRAAVVLSFSQFLLAVRSLALLRSSPGRVAGAVLSAVFAALAALLSHFAYPTYLPPARLGLVAVVAGLSCFCLLRLRLHPKTSAAGLLALAFAAGAFVNPVQKGDAGVLDSGLARAIRGIAEKDPSPWLVEGASFPMNQYPLLAGAPTLNAGNLYPTPDRWLRLDPEGKAKSVWNRYAVGIRFDLKPGGTPAFSLTGFDTFRIEAPNETIRQLGVRYVMSRNDLSALSNETAAYTLLDSVSGWHIYRLDLPSVGPSKPDSSPTAPLDNPGSQETGPADPAAAFA